MGTAAYGGKGVKGRAADSGERPMGAASRRQQHNPASCPPPPKWKSTSLAWPGLCTPLLRRLFLVALDLMAEEKVHQVVDHIFDRNADPDTLVARMMASVREPVADPVYLCLSERLLPILRDLLNYQHHELVWVALTLIFRLSMTRSETSALLQEVVQGCVRREGTPGLDTRLEEVAKAVGGGYCRLQNAVGTCRQGDSGWAEAGRPEGGGGGGAPHRLQWLNFVWRPNLFGRPKIFWRPHFFGAPILCGIPTSRQSWQPGTSPASNASLRSSSSWRPGWCSSTRRRARTRCACRSSSTTRAT